MKSSIIATIVIVCAILVATVIVSRKGDSLGPTAENVRIENGMQIIEIRAKGGYLPRRSEAKAGIPTIIRFETSGTFDCSAFVSIPSLKVSQQLALSGSTDIQVGTSTAGTLQGTCGMGMYPFEINFQS